MGRRKNTNDVEVKVAKVSLKREECALDMVQKSNTNDAVLKDAKVWHKEEECALSMGQRRNDTVL